MSSSSSSNSTPPVVLSEKQLYAQRLVVDKKQSVAVFGSAGSGKTTLLNVLKPRLPQGGHTYYCAPTGTAATLFGGRTLNSALMLPFLDTINVKKYCTRPAKGEKYYTAGPWTIAETWKGCEVLVIDEISMVSGAAFDAMEEIARTLRKNPAPFGGIRLILFGDFAQLPPVNNSNTNEYDYAFKARTFFDCIPRSNMVILDVIYRQMGETDLLAVLKSIRENRACTDPNVLRFLRAHQRDLEVVDGVEPTVLDCKNVSVDAENKKKLDTIQEKVYSYQAKYSSKTPKVNERLRKSFEARMYDRLDLKVGAQVMFTTNVGVLANGSRGVVVRFDEHKQNLPVVHFLNGGEMTVAPHRFAETDSPYSPHIDQLPLKHAWALTIHKAQGVSLDYGIVDLTDGFSNGQAYTALSRVRTSIGLQVRGYKLNGKENQAWLTNESVIQFYKEVQAYHAARLAEAAPETNKRPLEEDTKKEDEPVAKRVRIESDPEKVTCDQMVATTHQCLCIIQYSLYNKHEHDELFREMLNCDEDCNYYATIKPVFLNNSLKLKQLLGICANETHFDRSNLNK